VLALGAIHHKHTAKAACLAHLLHMVFKNLLTLHNKIHKQVIAVTGKRYKELGRS
jgi:hypothetical protein